MKVLIWTLLLTTAWGLAVPADAIITAPVAANTGEPELDKRFINPDYDKKIEKLGKGEHSYLKQNGLTTTSEPPKPWHRTIYGSVKEIVRPTVIAGVTLSAKPPATTNGLEPWIDLKKNGSPKTVKPELKNGHTKNPSPTYGTWFSTPTTRVYTKEELKAHNMDEDEVYEEVEYIEEDQTYHSLNPIIRCTPDRYFKKGINRQMKSEPFCSPRDNAVMTLGKSYFVTWYSRHFADATNVRFHFSKIKVSLKDKGLKKRSSIMDNGGKITDQSSITSDWVSNDSGLFPLEVTEDFFDSEAQMETKLLMSIQPDTVADEDFNYLENSLVIEFTRPTQVYTKHNQDLKYLEQKQKLKHLNIDEIDDGLDYEKYFAIMGIPTAVVLFGFLMYIFVSVNKVDLSHLKPKRARGKNHGHKKIPFRSKAYSQLPQHNKDVTKLE